MTLNQLLLVKVGLMLFSQLMVDQIEPNLKFSHNFNICTYHLVLIDLLYPPGKPLEGVRLYYHGGIVVRILHHVHQVHDVCIFVPMRLFGEKAAWVHQSHDTEQFNLFYLIIGLTHYEKQTSCT